MLKDKKDGILKPEKASSYIKLLYIYIIKKQKQEEKI
jgi:hypothetical protein